MLCFSAHESCFIYAFPLSARFPFRYPNCLSYETLLLPISLSAPKPKDTRHQIPLSTYLLHLPTYIYTYIHVSVFTAEGQRRLLDFFLHLLFFFGGFVLVLLEWMTARWDLGMWGRKGRHEPLL